MLYRELFGEKLICIVFKISTVCKKLAARLKELTNFSLLDLNESSTCDIILFLMFYFQQKSMIGVRIDPLTYYPKN